MPVHPKHSLRTPGRVLPLMENGNRAGEARYRFSYWLLFYWLPSLATLTRVVLPVSADADVGTPRMAVSNISDAPNGGIAVSRLRPCSFTVDRAFAPDLTRGIPGCRGDTFFMILSLQFFIRRRGTSLTFCRSCAVTAESRQQCRQLRSAGILDSRMMAG